VRLAALSERAREEEAMPQMIDSNYEVYVDPADQSIDFQNIVSSIALLGDSYGDLPAIPVFGPGGSDGFGGDDGDTVLVVPAGSTFVDDPNDYLAPPNLAPPNFTPPNLTPLTTFADAAFILL
jgi:hypothetical protein